MTKIGQSLSGIFAIFTALRSAAARSWPPGLVDNVIGKSSQAFRFFLDHTLGGEECKFAKELPRESRGIPALADAGKTLRHETRYNYGLSFVELKEIDNSESGKRRLNEALHIYRTTILPEAQNPERQIVYWIDHSREALADEFRCFAIEHDREIIGYLQYSYFREEHIFFFEYLCIRDQKRAGLLPSTALQRIERYLSQHYAPDFTIAFEIAHKRETPGEWVSDKKLTTYFKSLGFRRIQFGYRYPILQSYDGGTSYPADLMVRLPKDRVEISSSEMRTLLRCIYFKHYLRWDWSFHTYR